MKRIRIMFAALFATILLSGGVLAGQLPALPPATAEAVAQAYGEVRSTFTPSELGTTSRGYAK